MEKGEFLLFLQCFQKVCFQGVSKGVIVWEWVNDEQPVKLSKFEENIFSNNRDIIKNSVFFLHDDTDRNM